MTVTVTTVHFHPNNYAVYVNGELFGCCEHYVRQRLLKEVMVEYDVDETEGRDVDYDFWEGAPEKLEQVDEVYG